MAVAIGSHIKVSDPVPDAKQQGGERRGGGAKKKA